MNIETKSILRDATRPGEHWVNALRANVMAIGMASIAGAAGLPRIGIGYGGKIRYSGGTKYKVRQG